MFKLIHSLVNSSKLCPEFFPLNLLTARCTVINLENFKFDVTSALDAACFN